MKTLLIFMKRDIKLFFKDKGLFFTSLITPMILLVLYITFLENVYSDSLKMSIPEGITVSEKVIDAIVGGQLISSLLAVCCVTVAFCSNMLMVQDKVTGAKQDMLISPVKPSVLAGGYYLSTAIVTLIICLVALVGGLIYVGATSWTLSFADIALMALDVFLLVMFGASLSSVINFFLSSQGQISAVGTIVSSAYGFICGAYMPISQFPEGLQKVISFLPGTYGMSLIKNHATRGAFEKLEAEGLPSQSVEMIKDTMDCNLYFFDKKVDIGTMYLILSVSVAFLICAYIVMNVLWGKRKNK